MEAADPPSHLDIWKTAKEIINPLHVSIYIGYSKLLASPSSLCAILSMKGEDGPKCEAGLECRTVWMRVRVDVVHIP